MNYILQFLIIAAISFIGELLNKLIPLPVPGSVYGLLLLLVSLITGIVKADQIKDAANLLINIMPIFFVAPCVSLITVIDSITGSLLAILLITLVSTLIVMIVTGKTAQFMISMKKKKGDKENE